MPNFSCAFAKKQVDKKANKSNFFINSVLL
jgi:hypothetical protein